MNEKNKIDLNRCAIYDFGKYAGNTSNRLIKSNLACSNCRAEGPTTFIQQSPEERHKGWALCGTCTRLYNINAFAAFNARHLEYTDVQNIKTAIQQSLF